MRSEKPGMGVFMVKVGMVVDDFILLENGVYTTTIASTMGAN